jgi:hypothetical protein
MLDDLPLAVPHLQLTAGTSNLLTGEESHKSLTPIEVTSEVEPKVIQDKALETSDTSTTYTSDDADFELFSACEALMKSGKSKTFVIESVLNCKGAKFKKGMSRLNALMERYGDG